MIRCLLLVEGPFDRQRLSLLTKLFDSAKISIFPFGCDKLSEEYYFDRYEEEIRELLSIEKTFSYDDFDIVVQVCDLDGCFIDDSYIVENKNITKVTYFSDHIEAVVRDEIIKRNSIKRKNISLFLSSNKISLFYNSCNIDHVFDNKLNPSNKQKRNLSIDMYKKYDNDLYGFMEAIFSANKLKSRSYEDSWDEVKKDFNSLNSCSNLCFFIEMFQYELKNEYLVKYMSLKNDE